MRRSAILRSSTSSLLPVPLNSSKITSSMREPVSISAVATMVSEPPPSMLRAEPQKRLGRWGGGEGVGAAAPGGYLPGVRDHGVVGPRQARDGVEQDHHVALVLHQALGL